MSDKPTTPGEFVRVSDRNDIMHDLYVWNGARRVLIMCHEDYGEIADCANNIRNGMLAAYELGVEHGKAE